LNRVRAYVANEPRCLLKFENIKTFRNSEMKGDKETFKDSPKTGTGNSLKSTL